MCDKDFRSSLFAVRLIRRQVGSRSDTHATERLSGEEREANCEEQIERRLNQFNFGDPDHALHAADLFKRAR